MAVPIWKDYFVTLQSQTSAQFRIVADSVVLYTGRAYKKPDASNISIRINDICANYLKNVLPEFEQTTATPIVSPTFNIQELVDSAWVSRASVQFINDWSYDYSYNHETMGMGFPINGIADERQMIPYSVVGKENVNFVLTFVNGNTATITVAVKKYADFNIDFNDDYSKTNTYSDDGTAVVDLSGFNGVKKIVIDGKAVYDVMKTCGRYVLYYINAYGGWDAFLIEGNDMMSDAYTRNNRNVEHDNRNVANRGVENFVNEIERTFRFHTGYMNDAESERMHHLAGSTFVYLYDLETREMLPVVVTTPSLEYKTFKNNGNRLVQYTIDVKLAQSRMRR